MKRAADPKNNRRTAMWDAIRMQGDFTVASLVKATRQHNSSVVRYLTCLEAAGLVARGDTHPRTGEVDYKLVKDTGPVTPLLRRDGSPVPLQKTDAMWVAMRMLKEFTPQELAISASVEGCIISCNYANNYCRWLRRTGYLIRLGGRSDTAYRFVKFTGPKGPKMRRPAHIFDPNTGEVIPLTGGRAS